MVGFVYLKSKGSKYALDFQINHVIRQSPDFNLNACIIHANFQLVGCYQLKRDTCEYTEAVILQTIFLNTFSENVWISIKMLLKLVPKVYIDNKSSFV